MKTEGTEVRHIARGKGYFIASWRQVYVLDWRDTLTKESLDASVRGKHLVLRDHPAGVLVLNLMRSFEMPSAEIRRYAEEKQREDVGGVVAHATVIEAEGFWASAMRSTLAGLYLAARSPFPRKVYASTHEAAEWLTILAKESRAWNDLLTAAIRDIRETR